MQPLKAIIVEDDSKHVENLQNKLKEIDRQVGVIAICSNIDGAFEAINKHKPDLVFLDIDLENGEKGFDLIRKFDKPEFAVIFITQYNDSNIILAAFRLCALDYLPKPFATSDLNNAVNKVDATDSVKQTQSFAKNIKAVDGKPISFWYRDTRFGKTEIEFSNLLYCKSDGAYSELHLLKAVNNFTTYTTAKNLAKWEEDFVMTDVFRVHNQYMVNKAQVKDYRKNFSRDMKLIMVDGEQIPVARSKIAEVEKRLKK